MVYYRQSPIREEFRKLLSDFWEKPNFAEHYELVTGKLYKQPSLNYIAKPHAAANPTLRKDVNLG